MKSPAFTLMELLTVVGIIGLVAGLLLPALSQAKERAQVPVCLNNLRQIGLALEFYRQEDSQGRFPGPLVKDRDGVQKWTTFTLGGRTPKPGFTDAYLSAEARPLHPFLRESKVFRCPRDAGQRILPCRWPNQKPSNWETVGSSYHYNSGPLSTITGGGLRMKRTEVWVDGVLVSASQEVNREHAQLDLGGHHDGWVTNPSKFIVAHEPPARAYGCPDGTVE